METASATIGAATRKRSWKKRLGHELREYAITALYLYVWLAALLFYKTALLRAEGVAALPLGLAAGKALILGKFVLLGESAGVGSRLGARTLLHRIAWRTLSLLLLVVVLTVLEEFVVGWAHGRSAAQTQAEFETRSVLEMAAKCLLMLLVLVPFVVAKQVSLALGPGELRRTLLSRETRPAAQTRDTA
jgi:hypothetical protein